MSAQPSPVAAQAWVRNVVGRTMQPDDEDLHSVRFVAYLEELTLTMLEDAEEAREREERGRLIEALASCALYLLDSVQPAKRRRS